MLSVESTSGWVYEIALSFPWPRPFHSHYLTPCRSNSSTSPDFPLFQVTTHPPSPAPLLRHPLEGQSHLQHWTSSALKVDELHESTSYRILLHHGCLQIPRPPIILYRYGVASIDLVKVTHTVVRSHPSFLQPSSTPRCHELFTKTCGDLTVPLHTVTVDWAQVTCIFPQWRLILQGTLWSWALLFCLDPRLFLAPPFFQRNDFPFETSSTLHRNRRQHPSLPLLSPSPPMSSPASQ